MSIHKGQTLTETFIAKARKFCYAGLLAGTMLGGFTAQAQSHPSDNRRPVLTDENTSPKNIKTNNELLEQARENFPAIAALTATHYAAQLDSLSHALNRHIAHRQKPGEQRRVVVMNAYILDVGLALDLPLDDVVAGMLQMQNVTPTAEIIDDIAPLLYHRTTTAEGKATYSQRPATYDLERFVEDRDEAILIPVSDNTPKTAIPGLSLVDTQDMINAHESTHAVETHYTLDGIDMDKARGFNPYSREQLQENIDGLKYQLVLYKRETVADIAALGYMIRKGHDVSIIDILADARRADGDAMINLSTPVLLAFKADIEKMGIDQFRAMPEEDMLDFYIYMADTHAVNTTGLRIAYKYFTAENPEEQEYFDEKALTDDVFAKGVALGKLIRSAPSVGAHIMSAPPAPDPADIIALRNWDPLKLMIASAQKTSGIVTPESIVIAYGDIMDGLAADRVQRPECEHDITKKMMKLKEVFVNSLAEIDYAGINQAQGISPRELLKTKIAKYTP